MMCHKAKIMSVGNSFRMNVADTKPYNADFDGDEMNLHVPQSIVTHIELDLISGVGKQIVSPQNGGPSVGLIQDTATGLYKLTKNTTLINI